MIPRFTSFIKKNNLFLKTDRILLAVSGGIDSAVLSELFNKAGFSFGIAHCNFGLRGKESDAEEEFTRKLAEKYKVPFYVKRFSTSEHASRQRISVQMAARELRYNWFEEIRLQEHFDSIATAHHLDDQVETFLINMVRGTGISGLHGILPKQGKVVRPLLFAFRKDIAAYAGENHISFREDSSNREDKYVRNKIRLKILPLLEEINPDFRKTLTSEISWLRAWEEIGRKEIGRKLTGLIKKQKNRITVDLKALKNIQPADLYAWELLSLYGFNSSVVGEILANTDGISGRTFLSSTHRAVKDRNTLIIELLKAGKKERPRLISENRKSISRPVKLTFSIQENNSDISIPVGKEFASLDYDKLDFPLEIRKWKAGDSFHPFGMKGKKKVSDLLIDEKVSIPDKEDIYVLCSSGQIAWVIGRRIDQWFRITSRTKKIFRINLLKIIGS